MKVSVVVDTNVAIVANEKSPQASPECVVACTRRIKRIIQNHDRLVLDDGWRILNREYKRHLRSSGQPGAGDAFLRWVLLSRTDPDLCAFVNITPVQTDKGESYQEFPDDSSLTSFDISDHKFVAVAVAYERDFDERASILVAVDTDWWDYRDALSRNGVIVAFLCESDIRRLAGE